MRLNQTRFKNAKIDGAKFSYPTSYNNVGGGIANQVRRAPMKIPSKPLRVVRFSLDVDENNDEVMFSKEGHGN